MDLKVLPKIQRELWAKLAGVELVKSFYLAGGTCVALHLRHRESLDFDFFQPDAFSLPPLLQALSKLGKLNIDVQGEGTFVGSLNRVKISFFHYPYKLIGDTKTLDGITVVDLKDLVAMKMIAIGQRGSRKDFIDLHAILNAGWNFDAIFQCVDEKFEQQEFNRMHLLKSLTYFDDADAESMPKMFTEISWPDVKRDLVARVRKYVR